MFRLLKNGIARFFSIFTIKTKSPTAEQTFAWFEQKGIFEYTDDGFEIEIKDQIHQHRWDDIETVIGYKVFLIIGDDICMQLGFAERTLTISESTAGWPKFQKNLLVQIPAINKDWELAMVPVETTNLTLLYDKKGRLLEEIFPKQANITQTA